MKTVAQLTFIVLTFSMSSVFCQNQDTMNKNYSVEIIRYNIPANQRTNFQEAYEKAGTILQSSPFCLAYEVTHGTDEPQHYIVRIHWTSVDDHLNGFRKSKEFSSFFNLVKGFYNNIEEMKHYEVTDIVWAKK
jgi:heme-degrading monooxygenase HmoA